jgi:quercetin dioxygenase-like cupin family protein
MTSLPHIHTELAPGDPLLTDRSRSQLLRVVDGIVYVRGEDDDTVLTPGDSISLSAGDQRRIWNAGDETARVFLSETAEAELPKAA